MKDYTKSLFILLLLFLTSSLIAQPTTPDPVDKSYGISIDYTISWTTGSTTTNVEVYTDDAMQNLYYSAAEAGTSHVLTGLDYNTKYYWRVQDGVGWSDLWEFTTLLNSKPVLSHPADAGVVTTFTPSLHWYPAAPTGGYFKVEISTSGTEPDFSTNLLVTSAYPVDVSGTNPTYTVPAIDDLQAGSTYYWRVTTWLGDNFSESSDIYSFVVSSSLGPVAPTLIWPVGGETVYATNPWVTWQGNSITTGITYEVFVDDGGGFVSAGPTTTATLYQLTGLVGGTTYSWYVAASDGFTTNNSVTETFVVSSTLGVVAPTLYYPVGGETIYTAEPWFSWGSNSAATGLDYTVYIDDVSGDVVNTGTAFGPYSNITLAQITGYTFTGGGTYYWVVESTDGVTTATSAEGEFTVTSALAGTPVKPVISFPTDDALIYATSTYLYWYTGTDITGLSFEYELKQAAVPFDETGTVDGITGNFVEHTGLTSGESYHWRVRSYVGATYSDWSDEGTFEVEASVDPQPIIPTLAYPVDNPSIYSLNPWLSWYTEQYIPGIEYYVYLDDDSDLSADLLETFGPLTNQFLLLDPTVPLTPGNTYYWGVSSQFVGNPASNSGYQATAGEFTIVNNVNVGPQTPQLSSPIGNSAVDGSDFEFFWYVLGSTTDLTYTLEYKLDNADWSAAVVVNGLTTGSYDPPALTDGALYRWRVKSVYKGTISSGWSNEGVFITIDPLGPIQPLVGSPVGGVKLETATPTLSWFTSAEQNSGVSYNLVLSTTPDMATNLVPAATDISARSFQLSGLESNTTYYWQVQATNSEGVSEFSKAGVFATANITGVSEETVPDKFAVDQNYPNPFNPSTVIKYSVPETMFVTVKIFNILGQEVRTLVSQEITAGHHQVTWNGLSNSGSDLSTGIYIYSVKAGSQVVSKKMMLIK